MRQVKFFPAEKHYYQTEPVELQLLLTVGADFDVGKQARQ